MRRIAETYRMLGSGTDSPDKIGLPAAPDVAITPWAKPNDAADRVGFLDSLADRTRRVLGISGPCQIERRIRRIRPTD